MGKLEALVKSEITRLAVREVRKATNPLRHDVRALKRTLSRFASRLSLWNVMQLRPGNRFKRRNHYCRHPRRSKSLRLSPRLIQTLRKHLGISQKELAALVGVTVGAVAQWESGHFKPTNEKKAIIVALRKLGRSEVKELLEKMGTRKT